MTPSLTPDELSTRWNIAAKTLANWRSMGRGPAYSKIGRVILYPLEEVVEYERDATEFSRRRPARAHEPRSASGAPRSHRASP